jgi:hypothetical protein
VSFADTAVGKVSAKHVTSLNNSGSAAMTISSIDLTGSQAASFIPGGTCSAGSSVNAGGTCTIESSFAPGVGGANHATLSVVLSNGATLAVDLSGNGTMPAGAQAVMVLPSMLNFGGIVLGHSASNQRVTFTNNGSSPVVLQSAVFSGPFSGAAGGCMALPFTLQPGASCDLTVNFAVPGAVGPTVGSLVVTTEDGATSWTIPLSGQVTPAASNQGGGGCSSIQSGRDPMLPFLVLAAIAVIFWRRYRATQRRTHSD